MVVRTVTAVTGDEVRGLAAQVLRRLPAGEPGAVVLGLGDGGRAQLVAMINERFLELTGVEAVGLLRTAAKEVGGGAGGTGLVANAGGRRAEGLDRALDQVRHELRTLLAPH